MAPSADTPASASLTPGVHEAALRRVARHAWRLLLPSLLFAAAAGVWWQMRQVEQRARVFERALMQVHLDAERSARTARAALADGDGALDGLRALARRLTTRKIPPVIHDQAIAAAWRELRAAVDGILAAEVRGAALEGLVTRFESIATGILVASDELVDALVAADVPAARLRIAARQLLLIQRISTNVRRILEGGPGALGAADRFGRDMVIFGDVNTALLNGNRKLAITAVEDGDARQTLEGLGHDFRAAAGLVKRILDGAGTLARRDRALRKLESARGALVARLGRLRRSHAAVLQEQPDWRLLAGGALALALIGVLGAALQMVSDGRALRRRLDRVRSDEETLRHEFRAQQIALQRLGDAARRLGQGAEIDWSALDQGPASAAGRAIRDLAERASAQSARLRAIIDDQLQCLDGAAAKARGLDQGIDREAQRTQLAQSRSSELRGSAGQLREALSTGRADTVEAARGVHRAVDVCRSAATGLRLLDEALTGIEAGGEQLRVAHGALSEVERRAAELAEQSRILWINASLRASVDSAAAPALARLAEDAERVLDAARDTVSRAQQGRDGIASGSEGFRAAAKRGRWAGDSVRDALARATAALTKLEPVLTAFEERTREIFGRQETEQRLIGESIRELLAIGEGLRHARAHAQDLVAAIEHLRAAIRANQAEAARIHALATGASPTPEIVTFALPGAATEELPPPLFAVDRRND